jgi:outer membrane protein assembly factor BamB
MLPPGRALVRRSRRFYQVFRGATPTSTIHVVRAALVAVPMAWLLACGSSASAVSQLDGGVDADAGTRGSSDDASLDATSPDGTLVDATTDGAQGDAGGGDPTAATSYLLNPAHTSTIEDPTLAPPLALAWTHDFGSPLRVSYPLVADGLAYLVLTDETEGASPTLQLVALDETTGATAWGPVALPTTQLVGTHAYDGGRVFVVYDTATGCGASAYDGATGAPAWTVDVAGCASAAEPAAYEGILYVNGIVLAALDESTGATLWSETVPTLFEVPAVGAPAVTVDGVFVTTGCNTQSGFDRLTGALLWQDENPACEGAGVLTPVIAEGRDYQLGQSAPNVVLEEQTGARLGTFPGVTYPAVDGTLLVCNPRSSPLQAIDFATGQTVWTFAGDGQLNMSPVIAGGAVFIGSDSGMLFAVDEASGAPIWSAMYAPSETPILAAGQGHLLVWSESSSSITAYAGMADAGALPDGAASCTSPFGHCGTSCVDLATDPQNCGACDAGCNGTCAGGSCVQPTVLAAGEDPVDVAIDATYVYWLNSSAGQVRRVAKTGGQPATLSSSPGTYPWSLAVDLRNVYWTVPNFFLAGTNAAVMELALDGGAPVALGTQLGEPTDIAVGATAVFWTASSGSAEVQTAPIDGGAVASFAAGPAEGGPIAIDADNLYWSNGTDTYQAPLAGGAPLSIGPAALALAVDAAYVYLAYGDGSAGSVVRIPIGGGPATTLADSRPPSLVAVAVDATNVYWIEGDGTIGMGAVATMNKSGGTPVVLASGLQDPEAIAVDDTDVYFANTAAGEVEKIPK